MKEGDSLYKIGQMYNVDYVRIAEDNKIPLDQTLVVGQAIVIPNNNGKIREITVNGFAFPNIELDVLNNALTYLTYLNIFSYEVLSTGELKTLNDEELIKIANGYNVGPVMVVTNIGDQRKFNSDLAHQILNEEELQNKVINNTLNEMNQKGYKGVTIDFEYIFPEDENAYMTFLDKIKTKLKEQDYFLMVAVAPKTSNEQKGVLYEAHDYKSIGRIADYVIIMAYEWGYSGGPARAVAPINLIEEVLAYAVTEIPSNKILLGIPNYGYDWTLPYVEGSVARSLGNYEAVELARKFNQAIGYDSASQAPFFFYYDSDMLRHEVWFEDARSIQAKLSLVIKYNLEGVSYWTINRPFPQNYLVLKSLFNIKK